MKILSIETSCDETGISIIEARGGIKNTKFKILANNVASQINIHRQYGGVFPMMAKREHSRNLIPLFKKTLIESKLLTSSKSKILNPKQIQNIKYKILNREPELLEQFLKFISKIRKPEIDVIAVTHGPGLEPALWVGVNFARALSALWNIPVIPVNHMLGHYFSVFANGKEFSISNPPARRASFQFPILALLVSGGHTELILSKKFMQFKKIGETRDDAAGEAFDKVARILGLPYPGGPEISRLAKKARGTGEVKLPRPMLNSPDFDFSFSGLKTAVLYLTQKIGELTPEIKQEIAREFEDAAVEVLVTKTLRAAEKYKVKTIIVAGGVAANQHLREVFEHKIKNSKLTADSLKLLFPNRELATDNSLMIALAGYFQFLKTGSSKLKANSRLRARGNLTLYF